MFKACTRKYNHIGILRNSAYIQVGVAPKIKEYGDLSVLFKNLSFYNINNQKSVKSDKNFIASFISEK